MKKQERGHPSLETGGMEQLNNKQVRIKDHKGKFFLFNSVFFLIRQVQVEACLQRENNFVFSSMMDVFRVFWRYKYQKDLMRSLSNLKAFLFYIWYIRAGFMLKYTVCNPASKKVPLPTFLQNSKMLLYLWWF